MDKVFKKKKNMENINYRNIIIYYLDLFNFPIFSQYTFYI